MTRRSVNQTNQRIQVFARCSPLNNLDNKQCSPSVLEVVPEKNKLVLKDRKAFREYSFDDVFSPDSDQLTVYKAVAEPLIHEVLLGYHCTVFAYGQTGTGKTYTMEGERDNAECKWDDNSDAGIIPRCMHQLYEMLNQMEIVKFSVNVSFLEIYNEDVYDLLASDFSKLRLYDDPSVKDSIKVKGLKEVVVSDKNEVYAILGKGISRRHTAETELNATSSRSHTIFTVTVDITENTSSGEILERTGKLNLVDLAGSENVQRSGAVDIRAREAGSINQSLLTLRRVVTSLVENQQHIPYRESKLTRLLQYSLGGHAKTSIIATISPALCNYDETLSTLEYAAKAKVVNIKPEVHRRIIHKAKLKSLNNENMQLRLENAALLKDLEAARSNQGFFVNSEEHSNLINRITLLEKEVAVLKLENSKWQQVAGQKTAEVESLHEKILRQQAVAYANEDFCDKLRLLSQNQCASLCDMVAEYTKEMEQYFKFYQDDQNQMLTLLNKQKQNASFLDEISEEVKSSLDSFLSNLKDQADNESILEDSMKAKCVAKCEVFIKDRLALLSNDFKAEMQSIDNWMLDINLSLNQIYKMNECNLAALGQFVEKPLLIDILKDLEVFFCNRISSIMTQSSKRCRDEFYSNIFVLRYVGNLATSLSKKIDDKKRGIISHVKTLESVLANSRLTAPKSECRFSEAGLKLKEEVLKMGSQIDEFLSESLTKDIPTGATPQKWDFHSPKTLFESVHPMSQIQEYDVSSSFQSSQDTSFASDIFDLESFENYSSIEVENKENYTSDGNSTPFNSIQLHAEECNVF